VRLWWSASCPRHTTHSLSASHLLPPHAASSAALHTATHTHASPLHLCLPAATALHTLHTPLHTLCLTFMLPSWVPHLHHTCTGCHFYHTHALYLLHCSPAPCAHHTPALHSTLLATALFHISLVSPHALCCLHCLLCTACLFALSSFAWDCCALLHSARHLCARLTHLPACPRAAAARMHAHTLHCLRAASFSPRARTLRTYCCAALPAAPAPHRSCSTSRAPHCAPHTLRTAPLCSCTSLRTAFASHRTALPRMRTRHPALCSFPAHRIYRTIAARAAIPHARCRMPHSARLRCASCVSPPRATLSAASSLFRDMPLCHRAYLPASTHLPTLLALPTTTHCPPPLHYLSHYYLPTSSLYLFPHTHTVAHAHHHATHTTCLHSFALLPALPLPCTTHRRAVTHTFTLHSPAPAATPHYLFLLCLCFSLPYCLSSFALRTHNTRTRLAPHSLPRLAPPHHCAALICWRHSYHIIPLMRIYHCCPRRLLLPPAARTTMAPLAHTRQHSRTRALSSLYTIASLRLFCHAHIMLSRGCAPASRKHALLHARLWRMHRHGDKHGWQASSS